MQLLSTVTVALKLNYYYYILYFWRLVVIQTDCSLSTAKNRQWIVPEGREKVSRNQSAPITGAILMQATLAFFCRKRLFWKQPYMISTSVGVSTKSADINEREEEKLNPLRKPKIFKNGEWPPDTNKTVFVSEHEERGVKIIKPLNFTVLNRPLPEGLFLFDYITLSRLSAKFLQNTSTSLSTDKKKWQFG